MMRYRLGQLSGLCGLGLLVLAGTARGDTAQEAADWVARFAFVPPTVSTEGVCSPSEAALPSFAVTPAGTGRQLVRVALPFAPGTFPADLDLGVQLGDEVIPADVRPLTYHPGQPRFVRRAMVTFVYDFPDDQARTFQISLAPTSPAPSQTTRQPGRFQGHVGTTTLTVTDEGVEVQQGDSTPWRLDFVAPSRTWDVPGTVEIISQGQYYLWVRMLVPDENWPRIIEVRADALGTVAVRGHLQRMVPTDGKGRAPDIGWTVSGAALGKLHTDGRSISLGSSPVEHAFDQGTPAWVEGDKVHVDFPDAHLHKRGGLTVANTDGTGRITYLRCRESEQVPHQYTGWRTASLVVSLPSAAPWTELLEPAHKVVVAEPFFNAIYHEGLKPDLETWPLLTKVRQFHIDAIADCLTPGDDYGNVASMPHSGVFGMNRLNHGPAIFEESYRSCKAKLRKVGVQWCSNFYDLNIWWGTQGDPGFNHRHITDPAGLLAKLRSISSDPNSSKTLGNLWKRFREKTRRAITDWPTDSPAETEFKMMMADEFNTLLKDRAMGSAIAWNEFPQADRPAAPPADCDMKTLARYNRNLLEAVFGEEILHSRLFYRSRFGGTRYNNMARHHADQFGDDKSFMWRSNSAVDFCTKGYDAFFYAYEETGDPRMATALRWQFEFAREHVHTDTGQCRNIGDVIDAYRLYRFTGMQAYLDNALRLFRELRTKLSDGDLFSQGGGQIVKDLPFIDDDEHGAATPYAKPYIIGYALAGLPALAVECPDEPKLIDVVRAVANFMASAQDPLGGWRYPHPRSSGCSIGLSIEYAMQLSRAAGFLESRGEPIGALLDAIERTLQARILAWQKSGTFFSGLRGWERNKGALKEGQTIYDLYKKPEDRDWSRDFTEGAIGLGGCPPEGTVHFFETLDFYLAHRPAERLFYADDALAKVLARMKDKSTYTPPAPSKDFLTYGVEAKLPTFRDKLIERLTFPQAWDPDKGIPFADWRRQARATLLKCLLAPPPRADFEPAVIAREDRGSYEARKLVYNVSGDCRIPAYLLVPKGEGPFPAIICLHDHGAHFLIGKEKVVKPIDVPAEIAEDSEKWKDNNYGGRWVGDELAKRGYVVFAQDTLFWGDRGRKGKPEYEFQQALASNLFQMGMTWIGVNTWDDMRSADFVASLPEVDPQRIGAVGLSMGSHRTWMLHAASDRIAAAVAVCWMGTTESLMRPGNNQVKGDSAYSMLVPDLRNYQDYPDTISIACPKPLMIYNGLRDKLFPVPGVKAGYAKLHKVWDSQGVGDRLVTKLWDVPHTFNAEMQDEAFAWFDQYLKAQP